MFQFLLRNKFIRFLFVGGTATALQMLILAALVELAGLDAVVSSSVGYCLSAVYNYWLNYHLTFSSSKSHLETFPKFVVVAAIGLMTNGVSMAGFLWLGLYYVFAQVGATAVTLVLNFLLHKYWIYRS